MSSILHMKILFLGPAESGTGALTVALAAALGERVEGGASMRLEMAQLEIAARVSDEVGIQRLRRSSIGVEEVRTRVTHGDRRVHAHLYWMP